MLIGITGGTGFLGRYLIQHLAGQGHRLRCWYRPSSDRSGLEGVPRLEW
ncbi:MAG: NAD-dependent epimerase/dehydratase family protein, partial [Planctomycetes bacterium]|nr:NAD-dependent epimerase/dehydratase family protein [Planctomycetota bacterium]